MADPYLTVHAFDGGAQIGSALTAKTKKDSNRWTHKAGQDGNVSVTLKGDVSAAQLAERTYIRVNDGNSDVFAFVPTTKRRRALDSPGTTEVTLSGPGLRWILHKGQVFPEDTTDCAEPTDTRYLGWQSKYYDDGHWVYAKSHGRFIDGPFPTSRPKDYPASLAHFIAPSTDALAARTWYARKTFTLASDTDFIAVAAADDEYRVFIDNAIVFDTIGGGPFQWQKWQQEPVPMCAGEHTIAVEVRNLTRASAATNKTWFTFALAPPGADGKLQNANQIWNVYHDHSGGTFTLATAFGYQTAAIAWDADAATIQAALEAIDIPGAGNVTVSGSNTLRNERYSLSHDHTGGTFTLTAFGQTTAAIAYNATALQVEAAIENGIAKANENVTVTGTGASGDPWIIEFDNGLTLTEVDMTADTSGLTGGTTASFTNSQNAQNDPWVIEFTGDLGSTHVPLSADGSSLTGGAAINVDEVQAGQGAEATIKTDTSWVVLDDPATTPGLTPGHIARILLEECQGRGDTDLDHLGLGCTDTTDTKGATWPEIVLPVPLPADIHRVMSLIEEAGFQVEISPDMTLNMWVDRGTDRTASVSILAHSTGVTNLEAGQSETEILNVFRVRTDEGWHEVIDTTSVTARGRIEAGQSLEGFANEGEAETFTTPLLAQFAEPPRVTTADINGATTASVVPYVDEHMADLVTASAWSPDPDTFDEIPMRLIGISGQISEKIIRYSIELTD